MFHAPDSVPCHCDPSADREERKSAFSAASMVHKNARTFTCLRSQGRPVKIQKTITYELARLYGQELRAGRDRRRMLRFDQSGVGGWGV